jgi:hypothetical protein
MREVQLGTRVVRQLLFDGRCVVSRVVVQDDMQVSLCGRSAFDLMEKSPKFFGPVALSIRQMIRPVSMSKAAYRLEVS